MVARPTAEAIAAVARLKAMPKADDPAMFGYPGGELSGALHDVARLVKAGLGLRFATVDFGGWDMHENVGGPDGGQMFDRSASCRERWPRSPASSARTSAGSRS